MQQRGLGAKKGVCYPSFANPSLLRRSKYLNLCTVHLLMYSTSFSRCTVHMQRRLYKYGNSMCIIVPAALRRGKSIGEFIEIAIEGPERSVKPLKAHSMVNDREFTGELSKTQQVQNKGFRP